MKLEKREFGGYLLFIGGLQWFIGLLAAEAWYPGYSSRIDYVSELGIGPTALLYNASIFVLGVCVTTAAYFLHRSGVGKTIPFLIGMAGIGAMGLGIFPGYLQPMHSIATLIAIFFGSISAIASYKIQMKPMAYISVVLGLVSLGSAILFFPYLGFPTGSTVTFLGMAKGSLERWAIYPLIAWLLGTGSHLTGVSGDLNKSSDH
ncbi:MAG: DUF998 domain-containing protein [Candidatus Thorarchaeota archaeon]